MIKNLEQRTRFEELIREIAVCDILHSKISDSDLEGRTIDDVATVKIIKSRFKTICNEFEENYEEDDFRLAFDIDDEEIPLKSTYYKTVCDMYRI